MSVEDIDVAGSNTVLRDISVVAPRVKAPVVRWLPDA
jgi:hypothetical protein